MNRIAFLCAGGTGGHLFPAEALAHELVKRGWRVHLVTDGRAQKFAEAFPADATHLVAAANPSVRNPVRLLGAGLTLLRGYLQSRRLIRLCKPAVVAGFGGYPTLPPLLAAQHMGVPTLTHDANAVMGRANKLLSRRADLSAIGFDGVDASERVVVTGNPVRPAILEAATRPYPQRKAGDPFRLLVFGGSQGARFFSQLLPDALALLTADEKTRLHVVQQAREEDLDRVVRLYAERGVEAQVQSFFTDLADHLAAAHLVISRSGASTVTELAVVGRPAVFVPYPYALDHDQALNARALADVGAAQIVEEKNLSPGRLAGMLKEAMNDPKGLAERAENAKKTGKPESTQVLADCVERLAGGGQT